MKFCLYVHVSTFVVFSRHNALHKVTCTVSPTTDRGYYGWWMLHWQLKACRSLQILQVPIKSNDRDYQIYTQFANLDSCNEEESTVCRNVNQYLPVNQKILHINVSFVCIIQICSGITRGRVLNRELYAQRLQKLMYLHLSTIIIIIIIIIIIYFLYSAYKKFSTHFTYLK